tara:strand:+ start:4674 stop:6050 length:1377 start_codon:yes stop_codon:yes gene_type:complete
MKFRVEKDSMGSLKVPADAYFGVHTQRSFNNFQISGIEWNPQILISITLLKLACAKANNELKLLDNKKANAIAKACNEIIEGKFYDQFPLDIFQTGSGTSTHMNVNEVIANLANEILKGSKVHPNDDVNKGQSTNDIIPSSIRMASILLLDDLIENLASLKNGFNKKGNQFSKILKSGRTHLQDAVPITLGQEFNAYATTMGKHIERLKETKKYVKVLGMGGTAVGTGINTSPRFRKLIIKHLNKETKLNFSITKDGIESTQFLTDIAALSSVLKLIAIDMNKISNDLRLLSSGPKTGLNEINLPAMEPGSSIMPGKINPAICEVVNMVCHQVIGNDTAITLSCMSGNLELNTHMPIIGHNIIESIGILTNASKTFADKCISGITANKETCEAYAAMSPSLATALNPYLGYDKVALLVKESLKTNKSVKELVLEKKLMSKKELDRVLDPKKLTRPNLR